MVGDRFGDERGATLGRRDVGDDHDGITTLVGDQGRRLLRRVAISIRAHDRGALPGREHGDRPPVADGSIRVVGALGARTDDQHPATGQAGPAHGWSLVDPRPWSSLISAS